MQFHHLPFDTLTYILEFTPHYTLTTNTYWLQCFGKYNQQLVFLFPNIQVDQHILVQNSLAKIFKTVIPFIRRLYFGIPSKYVKMMRSEDLERIGFNLKRMEQIEFPDAMYGMMRPLWKHCIHAVQFAKLGDEFTDDQCLSVLSTELQNMKHVKYLKIRSLTLPILELLITNSKLYKKLQKLQKQQEQQQQQNDHNCYELKGLIFDKFSEKFEKHIRSLFISYMNRATSLNSLRIMKSVIDLSEILCNSNERLTHLSYHGSGYFLSESDAIAINTSNIRKLEIYGATDSAMNMLAFNTRIETMGIYASKVNVLNEHLFEQLNQLPNLKVILLNSMIMSGKQGQNMIQRLHQLAVHNQMKSLERIRFRDRVTEEQSTVLFLLRLLLEPHGIRIDYEERTSTLV